MTFTRWRAGRNDAGPGRGACRAILGRRLTRGTAVAPFGFSYRRFAAEGPPCNLRAVTTKATLSEATVSGGGGKCRRR
jgi:hypothetical protein